MLIGLCINSASGLAMLLMVTMFPILIGLGVSRLAATAAVASTLCFDWSPSDTGTILSATTAGVDPVLYWTNYQVPIVMVAFVVVGALHYFTQKYMDKRMGHVVKPMEVEKAEENPADSAPLWYAVLPVIPLSLILSFSSLWITTIKMNIVMAMFIGLFIGACCEFARWRDGKKVFADIQTFFDGLGMQMAMVEFARNVLGYEDANSSELNPDTTHPVVDLMPDQNGIENLGGTLRLGSYPCVLDKKSKAYALYGTELINERHRHRFEINNHYRDDFTSHGMMISGQSPDGHIVEMIELPDHPFYVGIQAHPELKSRPNHAHPLFAGFVESAEEQGVLRRAKKLLMKRNHLSEPEAHRYLQKTSMDTGRTMTESAHMVTMLIHED